MRDEGPPLILLILACRRMDAVAYSITFPLLSIATSYFIFELKRQEQMRDEGPPVAPLLIILECMGGRAWHSIVTSRTLFRDEEREG